jgi:hypothetical protein
MANEEKNEEQNKIHQKLPCILTGSHPKISGKKLQIKSLMYDGRVIQNIS